MTSLKQALHEGPSPKKATHENKLPLLTEAIRSTDRNYGAIKNKAETLESLKQQIFRNWNKSGNTLPQPREIFTDSKRPGSPIDDELRRKRSKSSEVRDEPAGASERSKFNVTVSTVSRIKIFIYIPGSNKRRTRL